MKEDNTILNTLVGMEGATQLLNEPEKFSALFEERFKLSDLNITARVLLHWKEKGLLPDKNDSFSSHENEIREGSKDDKWKSNRFNFFELVYLFILQDLREFGLSLEKLKNVKRALLHKLDFLEYLPLITEKSIEDAKKQGVDTTIFEEVLNRKQEIIDSIDEIPETISKPSVLYTIILSAILNKQDIRILISKSGNVSIDVLNTVGQMERNSINTQPHIALPLFSYLIRFLSTEKYSQLYVAYKLLDDQEKLILEHVRSGRYKEITIRFNRRKSITLELTEDLKTDITTKLIEILIKGGYQDLQVKTEKGVINYSSIMTKKQI